TEVGDFAVLPEAELVAQHDPLRPFARARLLGLQQKRWTDRHQPAEVCPMDPVTEADPTLVPAAAVKEVSVQTAKVAGEKQEIWRRDVSRVNRGIADLEAPDW